MAQRTYSLDEVLDYFGVTREELEAEPDDPVEHHCTVTPDLNVTGFWTGLCSCGYMTGDSTQLDAEREAREHEADPEQPKLEPWHPGKHPTPNR